MAHSKAARDWVSKSAVRAFGSRHLLSVLTALVGGVFVLLWWLLPGPLILPTFSLLALAAAGIAATIAWCSQAERSSDRVTSWDVAGALAFIGFAAGMLGDPAHLVQLGEAMTAE
jgi:hypothetical protein